MSAIRAHDGARTEGDPVTDASPAHPPAAPLRDTSAVVELRQYTLHPGQREVLVELFERELVESQETVGMRVLGQFRDLDRPDRFVWLRGFPDMASRGRGLAAFYGGLVWKAHRTAANATMIDSDDVLLLRPADAESGFVLPSRRAPLGGAPTPASLVVVTLYLLARAVDGGFVHFFDTQVAPVMIGAGAPPLARLLTKYAENDFTALPVRTGVNVFVWFASFDGPSAHADHLTRLARTLAWTEGVWPELSRRLVVPPERLRLEPTPRSLVGRAPGARRT
jgi:hypothetical protein